MKSCHMVDNLFLGALPVEVRRGKTYRIATPTKMPMYVKAHSSNSNAVKRPRPMIAHVRGLMLIVF